MASIQPRTNKDGTISFRVMFRIDGRQAQESFLTAETAEQFCGVIDRIGGRAARELRMAQEMGSEQAPLLSEWVREYLDPESGLLSGVTAGTRDNYRMIAERSFLPRLGDFPVDLVDEDAVRAWLNWQIEQPTVKYPDRTISAKSVKNYHALLSGALGAAAKRGIVARNVAYGLTLPKGFRPPICFLTEGEFACVYRATLEWYKPLMLTLASTGLRFGEATALTWADLVMVNGEWCFDVNKAWKQGERGQRRVLGPPKSGAGVRLVSVSVEVVQALGTPGKSHELIFKTREGAVVSAGTFAKYGLKRAVRISGISKDPRNHDLRHSHASWLIAKGVPLPYIQRRLGHENIDTTVRVYGHLMPDALNATREAAADAIKLALLG
ncbi:site-specific integrase [Leucobacter viscericola]|uniref:Site-specific integrase n=1 Tax=Leucobacter viscericola TaxID=2714935 RepID=A0A6G7XIW7_9MICO|nr:site-specific integrase [Leucobacter viscericola]QIK64515.1 site-specific integrase [Leucobacter viscericola]QIK64587.1 site-specific integrase [Leucobacter viscericola]